MMRGVPIALLAEVLGGGHRGNLRDFRFFDHFICARYQVNLACYD